MTVDKEYCFDPDTQTNCNQNPGALLRGRTVFFAVQPRYLNVDIRITIDVTLGGTALIQRHWGLLRKSVMIHHHFCRGKIYKCFGNAAHF